MRLSTMNDNTANRMNDNTAIRMNDNYGSNNDALLHLFNSSIGRTRYLILYSAYSSNPKIQLHTAVDINVEIKITLSIFTLILFWNLDYDKNSTYTLLTLRNNFNFTSCKIIYFRFRLLKNYLCFELFSDDGNKEANRRDTIHSCIKKHKKPIMFSINNYDK